MSTSSNYAFVPSLLSKQNRLYTHALHDPRILSFVILITQSKSYTTALMRFDPPHLVSGRVTRARARARETRDIPIRRRSGRHNPMLASEYTSSSCSSSQTSTRPRSDTIRSHRVPTPPPPPSCLFRGPMKSSRPALKTKYELHPHKGQSRTAPKTSRSISTSTSTFTILSSRS